MQYFPKLNVATFVYTHTKKNYTSLKLLKLIDIVVMHRPARFFRGTRMWPICILQILKIIVSQNKTKQYCRVIIYLFTYFLLKYQTLIDSDELFVINHKIIILLNISVEKHIKLIFNKFYLVTLYCAFMLTTCIIDDVII